MVERTASKDRAAKPLLRTYGKRTAESASKKRKVEDEAAERTSDKTTEGKAECQDRVPEPAATVAQSGTKSSEAQNDDQDGTRLPDLLQPKPGKRSILSYFQVVASRKPATETSTWDSETSASCEPSSEAMAPSLVKTTETPPSSPPPMADKIQRKRRRLTTKPGLRNTNDEDGDQTDQDKTSSLHTGAIPGDGQHDASGSKPLATDTSIGRPKKKARRNASTLQTTISLSMDDQGLVECKECGMLYNSLHEKDVRIHKRRHGELAREKKLAAGRGDTESDRQRFSTDI